MKNVWTKRLAVAVCAVVALGAVAWFAGFHPRRLFGRSSKAVALTVPPGGKTGFTRLAPEQIGIAFVNDLSDEHASANRILNNGSGVALGDVDGDGRCDVYFCGLDGDNVLYRNLGDWKFEDVTAKAGVGLPGVF